MFLRIQSVDEFHYIFFFIKIRTSQLQFLIYFIFSVNLNLIKFYIPNNTVAHAYSFINEDIAIMCVQKKKIERIIT